MFEDFNLTTKFPRNFIWGVATSAFQIEGASQVSGKGESIWDRFCKTPGVIADGSNGDVACDHYNRLEEDLDLIASLGVNAYRFSISWPRVQPLGLGAWSDEGLDFYSRLVDGLNQRGIAAHVTLNHWDLPQHLQDLGGWESRETVEHFVRYALGIYAHLGSRVAAITTHNEPWVIAVLGHETGIFAPGIKNRRIAVQVSHHLLLSHGRAVRALREAGCQCPIGIVLNLSPIEPASQSEADVASAHMGDARGRRWYTDPLFKGHYPQEVIDELGSDAPVVAPGDMVDIAAPIDFLGVNYYTRQVASANGPVDLKALGLSLTEMGWEVYPKGLTDLLLLLHNDYQLPEILITENGGAFKDLNTGGAVMDTDRLDYIRTHIAAVAAAMDQGVRVGGYMVWSLLDNFEWASGYEKRFGIVHVDYDTLKRTPKQSAKWYREFLAASRMFHESKLRA
ncbi:MAG: hypothetical protein RLY30_494 [Pseudomonadota bacterium]|jgi:beta-glucosidase